jgi:plasmid stability protein
MSVARPTSSQNFADHNLSRSQAVSPRSVGAAGDCIDIANSVQRPVSQIVIRNIDAAVIEALRRRAAACGTSMEEQARRALTTAVGLDREAAARRLTEIRRKIGRLEGPSILDDLRRDRGRDEA